MASGSVPINYADEKIDDVKINSLGKQGNIKFEKAPRYFWDAGILSNTSLRELIQSHKEYWFGVVGNIVSDYVALVKKFIGLAKKHKIEKEEINQILSETTPRSRHRSGDERKYKNLINGRFDVNV